MTRQQSLPKCKRLARRWFKEELTPQESRNINSQWIGWSFFRRKCERSRRTNYEQTNSSKEKSEITIDLKSIAIEGVDNFELSLDELYSNHPENLTLAKPTTKTRNVTISQSCGTSNSVIDHFDLFSLHNLTFDLVVEGKSNDAQIDNTIYETTIVIDSELIYKYKEESSTKSDRTVRHKGQNDVEESDEGYGAGESPMSGEEIFVKPTPLEPLPHSSPKVVSEIDTLEKSTGGSNNVLSTNDQELHEASRPCTVKPFIRKKKKPGHIKRNGRQVVSETSTKPTASGSNGSSSENIVYKEGECSTDNAESAENIESTDNVETKDNVESPQNLASDVKSDDTTNMKIKDVVTERTEKNVQVTSLLSTSRETGDQEESLNQTDVSSEPNNQVVDQQDALNQIDTSTEPSKLVVTNISECPEDNLYNKISTDTNDNRIQPTTMKLVENEEDATPENIEVQIKIDLIETKEAPNELSSASTIQDDTTDSQDTLTHESQLSKPLCDSNSSLHKQSTSIRTGREIKRRKRSIPDNMQPSRSSSRRRMSKIKTCPCCMGEGSHHHDDSMGGTKRRRRRSSLVSGNITNLDITIAEVAHLYDDTQSSTTENDSLSTSLEGAELNYTQEISNNSLHEMLSDKSPAATTKRIFAEGKRGKPLGWKKDKNMAANSLTDKKTIFEKPALFPSTVQSKDYLENVNSSLSTSEQCTGLLPVPQIEGLSHLNNNLVKDGKISVCTPCSVPEQNESVSQSGLLTQAEYHLLQSSSNVEATNNSVTQVPFTYYQSYTTSNYVSSSVNLQYSNTNVPSVTVSTNNQLQSVGSVPAEIIADFEAKFGTRSNISSEFPGVFMTQPSVTVGIQPFYSSVLPENQFMTSSTYTPQVSVFYQDTVTSPMPYTTPVQRQLQSTVCPSQQSSFTQIQTPVPSPAKQSSWTSSSCSNSQVSPNSNDPPGQPPLNQTKARTKADILARLKWKKTARKSISEDTHFPGKQRTPSPPAPTRVSTPSPVKKATSCVSIEQPLKKVRIVLKDFQRCRSVSPTTKRYIQRALRVRSASESQSREAKKNSKKKTAAEPCTPLITPAKTTIIYPGAVDIKRKNDGLHYKVNIVSDSITGPDTKRLRKYNEVIAKEDARVKLTNSTDRTCPKLLAQSPDSKENSKDNASLKSDEEETIIPSDLEPEKSDEDPDYDEMMQTGLLDSTADEHNFNMDVEGANSNVSEGVAEKSSEVNNELDSNTLQGENSLNASDSKGSMKAGKPFDTSSKRHSTDSTVNLDDTLGSLSDTEVPTASSRLKAVQNSTPVTGFAYVERQSRTQHNKEECPSKPGPFTNFPETATNMASAKVIEKPNDCLEQENMFSADVNAVQCLSKDKEAHSDVSTETNGTEFCRSTLGVLSLVALAARAVPLGQLTGFVMSDTMLNLLSSYEQFAQLDTSFTDESMSTEQPVDLSMPSKSTHVTLSSSDVSSNAETTMQKDTVHDSTVTSEKIVTTGVEKTYMNTVCGSCGASRKSNDLDTVASVLTGSVHNTGGVEKSVNMISDACEKDSDEPKTESFASVSSNQDVPEDSIASAVDKEKGLSELNNCNIPKHLEPSPILSDRLETTETCIKIPQPFEDNSFAAKFSTSSTVCSSSSITPIVEESNTFEPQNGRSTMPSLVPSEKADLSKAELSASVKQGHEIAIEHFCDFSSSLSNEGSPKHPEDVNSQTSVELSPPMKQAEGTGNEMVHDPCVLAVSKEDIPKDSEDVRKGEPIPNEMIHDSKTTLSKEGSQTDTEASMMKNVPSNEAPLSLEENPKSDETKRQTKANLCITESGNTVMREGSWSLQPALNLDGAFDTSGDSDSDSILSGQPINSWKIINIKSEKPDVGRVKQEPRVANTTGSQVQSFSNYDDCVFISDSDDEWFAQISSQVPTSTDITEPNSDHENGGGVQEKDGDNQVLSDQETQDPNAEEDDEDEIIDLDTSNVDWDALLAEWKPSFETVTIEGDESLDNQVTEEVDHISETNLEDNDQIETEAYNVEDSKKHEHQKKSITKRKFLRRPVQDSDSEDDNGTLLYSQTSRGVKPFSDDPTVAVYAKNESLRTGAYAKNSSSDIFASASNQIGKGPSAATGNETKQGLDSAQFSVKRLKYQTSLEAEKLKVSTKPESKNKAVPTTSHAKAPGNNNNTQGGSTQVYSQSQRDLNQSVGRSFDWSRSKLKSTPLNKSNEANNAAQDSNSNKTKYVVPDILANCNISTKPPVSANKPPSNNIPQASLRHSRSMSQDSALGKTEKNKSDTQSFTQRFPTSQERQHSVGRTFNWNKSSQVENTVNSNNSETRSIAHKGVESSLNRNNNESSTINNKRLENSPNSIYNEVSAITDKGLREDVPHTEPTDSPKPMFSENVTDTMCNFSIINLLSSDESGNEVSPEIPILNSKCTSNYAGSRLSVQPASEKEPCGMQDEEELGIEEFTLPDLAPPKNAARTVEQSTSSNAQLPNLEPPKSYARSIKSSTSNNSAMNFSQLPDLGPPTNAAGKSGRSADKHSEMKFSQLPNLEPLRGDARIVERSISNNSDMIYSQLPDHEPAVNAARKFERSTSNNSEMMFSQLPYLEPPKDAARKVERSISSSSDIVYSQCLFLDSDIDELQIMEQAPEIERIAEKQANLEELQMVQQATKGADKQEIALEEFTGKSTEKQENHQEEHPEVINLDSSVSDDDKTPESVHNLDNNDISASAAQNETNQSSSLTNQAEDDKQNETLSCEGEIVLKAQSCVKTTSLPDGDSAEKQASRKVCQNAVVTQQSKMSDFFGSGSEDDNDKTPIAHADLSTSDSEYVVLSDSQTPTAKNNQIEETTAPLDESKGDAIIENHECFDYDLPDLVIETAKRKRSNDQSEVDHYDRSLKIKRTMDAEQNREAMKMMSRKSPQNIFENMRRFENIRDHQKQSHEEECSPQDICNNENNGNRIHNASLNLKENLGSEVQATFCETERATSPQDIFAQACDKPKKDLSTLHSDRDTDTSNKTDESTEKLDYYIAEEPLRTITSDKGSHTFSLQIPDFNKTESSSAENDIIFLRQIRITTNQNISTPIPGLATNDSAVNDTTSGKPGKSVFIFDTASSDEFEEDVSRAKRPRLSRPRTNTSKETSKATNVTPAKESSRSIFACFTEPSEDEPTRVITVPKTNTVAQSTKAPVKPKTSKEPLKRVYPNMEAFNQVLNRKAHKTVSTRALNQIKQQEENDAIRKAKLDLRARRKERIAAVCAPKRRSTEQAYNPEVGQSQILDPEEAAKYDLTVRGGREDQCIPCSQLTLDNPCDRSWYIDPPKAPTSSAKSNLPTSSLAKNNRTDIPTSSHKDTVIDKPKNDTLFKIPVLPVKPASTIGSESPRTASESKASPEDSENSLSKHGVSKERKDHSASSKTIEVSSHKSKERPSKDRHKENRDKHRESSNRSSHHSKHTSNSSKSSHRKDHHGSHKQESKSRSKDSNSKNQDDRSMRKENKSHSKESKSHRKENKSQSKESRRSHSSDKKEKNHNKEDERHVNHDIAATRNETAPKYKPAVDLVKSLISSQASAVPIKTHTTETPNAPYIVKDNFLAPTDTTKSLENQQQRASVANNEPVSSIKHPSFYNRKVTGYSSNQHPTETHQETTDLNATVCLSQELSCTFVDKLQEAEQNRENLNKIPKEREKKRNMPVKLSDLPQCDMKSKQPLAMDGFYKAVLRWNPVWLDEQLAMRAPPPVCGEHPLQVPLLESYDTYDEYARIMLIPFYYETWEGIFQAWEERKRRNRDAKLYGFIVSPAIAQQISLLTLQVTVKGVKGNYEFSEGDFVKLKVNTQNARIRFGYVIKSDKVTRGGNRITVHDMLKAGFMRGDCDVYQLSVKVFLTEQWPLSSPVIVQSIDALTTQTRQYQALISLPQSPLAKNLLRPCSTQAFIHPPPKHKLTSESLLLNASQQEAVDSIAYALQQPYALPKICLLQGPPGTGKSTVITAIIHSLLTHSNAEIRNPKILLCAPSNAGIDNLCRKLCAEKKLQKRLSLVRVGAKERMSRDILHVSLDARLEENKATRMKQKEKGLVQGVASVQSAVQNLDNKIKTSEEELKLQQLQGNMNKVEQLRKLIQEQKSKREKFMRNAKLFEISRNEEEQIRRALLRGANVVCCTLNTAGKQQLLDNLQRVVVKPLQAQDRPVSDQGKKSRPHFTCVIVDEAAQALEMDSLIPLQYLTSKLVLVGDPKQLPATVKSLHAGNVNYGQSLFERLYEFLQNPAVGQNPVQMLTTQYRMHPEICQFPSQHVYSSRLQTDPDIAKRRAHFPFIPYVLFDLMSSKEEQKGTSSFNREEARLVTTIARHLLTGKVKARDIGVITPYKTQAQEVRKILGKELEDMTVDTVDGFQGCEKHVIIISTVRTSQRSVGFLSDARRMNVALTRAKYALYVVCNFAALLTDENWAALVRDGEQRQVTVKLPANFDPDKIVPQSLRPLGKRE